MKCDNCKSRYYHPGSQDQPAPERGCMLGHLVDTDGPSVNKDPDPWANCVDFNPVRLEDCGGCPAPSQTPALNAIPDLVSQMRRSENDLSWETLKTLNIIEAESKRLDREILALKAKVT